MTSPYALTWTARPDRRFVSTGGDVRHILVDVAAPERPRPDGERRPPLNLGLVIDVSGSMNGAPLTAAKQAARGVVQQLRADDRVTLVSFASDVIVHATRMACDHRGRAVLEREIDGLCTRGMTNLSEGWLTGCQCVADAMDRAPAGVRHRVVVLSDGMANEGICNPVELGRHAGELRQRGLYTSAVGIGDGYSPTQLQALAEHGGGRLHDAPVGADIVSVVLGELGEIMETAGDDLRLDVRTGAPGLQVSVIGPYGHEADAGGVVVNVGSLTAGASRQVVLRVEDGLRNREPGTMLPVTVAASWRDGDDGAWRQAAPMTVAFTVATEAVVASEVADEAVQQAVMAVWEQALVMDSTMLNTEGRFGEAREMVELGRREMMACCASVDGVEEAGERLEKQVRDVARRMNAREARGRTVSMKMRLKGERDFRGR